MIKVKSALVNLNINFIKTYEFKKKKLLSPNASLILDSLKTSLCRVQRLEIQTRDIKLRILLRSLKMYELFLRLFLESCICYFHETCGM